MGSAHEINDPKQYVLDRFPSAIVRKVGAQVRLEGIPGLVSSGIDEAAAWAGAAKELADPVLESAREQNVLEQVLASFKALQGPVVQPMELTKRLELDGYTTTEAVSAINSAVSSGALVKTSATGLRLT